MLTGTQNRFSKSLLPCSMALFVTAYITPTATLATTTESLNCSSNYQIVQTLNNGAKWEMCWEPRAGYGYLLSQVIYTAPNDLRRKVLETMHVAQMLVPYDDNRVRYRDITYGVSMKKLNGTECPNGTLLTNSTLCLVRRPKGLGVKNLLTGTSAQSEALTLYGYYGVGAYYYIFQYSFFDDGSIEPAVGASGSLQRFGGSNSTGWPVKSQVGINHNHLIFWRMDFDVDGKTNNVVEQIEFNGNGSATHGMTITPLGAEAAAKNDVTKQRFWRVRNSTQANANGRSVSYEIEPSVTDQLRLGSEPFTQNDFYVTQFKANENLVDDGSGLHKFINGETLTDPVLWYGVNFHHVPRDEDDVRMPAHWQGFRIRPRDVVATAASGSVNRPPVLISPGSQTTAAGTAVSLTVSGSDPDGDTLTYSASGLPSGLGINANTGTITGTPTAAGSSSVTITVNDGQGNSTSASFSWTVTSSTGAGSTQTFTSTATTSIPLLGTATPYPLPVRVNGLSGTISAVTVQLRGLSHTYPADLDVLLVGPAGQKVMLMSDAGGGTDVVNLTLNFAASGASLSSAALAANTYVPGNLGTTGDSFAAPAPATPYGTSLSVFNGTNPNGVWNLYVNDDAGGDRGTLSAMAITVTTR